MKDEAKYRLGADIGGTFTDVVLLNPEGGYQVKKVSSTPSDYAVGILNGATQLFSEHDVDGTSIQEIIHGTTVASNTVLENKGVETALLTTKGFRDVLELRRLRVPHLYSLFYEPPNPLVSRRLRLEIDERIGAQGEIVRPLDEASIFKAIERIREEGASSIAICLLHSYRNGDHERQVGEIVRRELPDLFCCLSVDVLAEIREYERTSTTVINAYLGPIVKSYMDSLNKKAISAGISAPLRIMQSNGGVLPADLRRHLRRGLHLRARLAEARRAHRLCRLSESEGTKSHAPSATPRWGKWHAGTIEPWQTGCCDTHR